MNPIRKRHHVRAAACLLAVPVLVLLLPSPASAAADCAWCGRPLEGASLEWEGRTYHEACWRDHVAPRCAVCGKLLEGPHVLQEGKPYHRSCWEERVAPRCSLCGGILEGRYLRDFWGNAYHRSHASETAPCEYCGRMISEGLTGGGVRYADGREICNLCRKQAVTRPGEVRSLAAEVSRRLGALGMDVDVAPIGFNLIDREEMRTRFPRGHARPVGNTLVEWETVTDGRGTREKRTVEVYILTGMPRPDAIGALAHELAHVWRQSRSRAAIDPVLEEGSANYAAWLVLGAYPGPATDYVHHRMLEDPDPSYGEGFRRVKKYAEEKGTPAWLDLFARGERLPPGY